MRLVLDTNAYSEFQKGKTPKLRKYLAVAEEIILPFIVAAELMAGFSKGTKPKENNQKLDRFLSSGRVVVLYGDEETIKWYAKLWADLAAAGTPIPTNDVWIAALCLQHGLTLTSSDKHFKHVPLLSTIPVE